MPIRTPNLFSTECTWLYHVHMQHILQLDVLHCKISPSSDHYFDHKAPLRLRRHFKSEYHLIEPGTHPKPTILPTFPASYLLGSWNMIRLNAISKEIIKASYPHINQHAMKTSSNPGHRQWPMMNVAMSVARSPRIYHVLTSPLVSTVKHLTTIPFHSSVAGISINF